MTEQLIVEQSEFDELCKHIRAAGIVAFDTEFISEYTYRPELCLLQFGTPERHVAVDPYAVGSLDRWWDLMADDTTTVVIHGGQAEVRFCLDLGGKHPQNVVDIQIAEGLRSTSYPLSYSALVTRVLHKRVHGKETRTDWRRRPLSDRQISYAVDDVRFTLGVWERQRKSLEQLGRKAWAEAEFRRMVDNMAADLSAEGLWRLPGVRKLAPRELAVARQLSEWRDNEAARRNRPIRRILRDDLLVELAHRQPRTISEILATRDMNRDDYKRLLRPILQCIEEAISIPDTELPMPPEVEQRPTHGEETVLGQLLGIALSNRCAEMSVSRQLVGTTADLRDLVRWHASGASSKSPPRLMTGWRADVCGNLLTDLLEGKISLRVSDPASDHPLAFESTDGK